MTPYETVALIMTLVILSFCHGHRQGKESGRLDGIEYCLVFMIEKGWMTEEGHKEMENLGERT